MDTRRPIRILYPPVVAAHISRDLGDLVAPHIRDHESFEVYFSSQPNSRPHLGTLTTASCAFALAYHLKARFGKDAYVHFEALDNAPAKKREVNGFTFFKPMCYTMQKGASLADRNLASFEHFMKELQTRCGIAFNVSRYEEIQRSNTYRKKLQEVLEHEESLRWYLNPVDGIIKLRPLCKTCRYGEKSGELTKSTYDNGILKLESVCHAHGPYTQEISDNQRGYIDLNTPVRSLIRKALLMDASREDRTLRIMVDGSDWVGMAQQLIPCFGVLGYSIQELPVRFFAPLIEDAAGSKFSKSAYVNKGTYHGIPAALCDYREFQEHLGATGFDMLWNEAIEWVLDSKKFFRNYTVEYFTQRWNL